MESFQDVWKSVKDVCKQQMTETAANLWIEALKFVQFQDDIVIINCDQEFIKNLVINKYADKISQAFEDILGFRVTLKFLTNEEASLYEKNQAMPGTASPQEKEEEYQHTFQTFIVGSSNKFAHAAAVAVASNPGGKAFSSGMSYNPLFIYGNSGLGKTHLLNAICYEIKKNAPETNILFVHAEDFTNEFIYHLGHQTTAVFHEKYRNADVLLVDDVQFIAGKTQTQEEFFHTFNALITAEKQIILTSDRPPKEIQTLEERMRTRFEWGLLADIQPPEFETRVAIIRRKAEMLNIEISDDVVQFIAEKVKSDIRQLEGTVKKLKARYLIDGEKPTLAIAQSAIRDIISNSQPTPQLVEKIIAEVAKTFEVRIEDLLSKKRNTNFVNARQVAMYIIREVTGLSVEQIGEKFNNHHSTVLYSIKQVESGKGKNATLNATINDIIKNVKDN